MSRAPAPPSNRTGPAWSALAALGLSGVLVLLGAEWLFFVTKVSFLSSLPAVERFSVPARVAAWMTAAVALYLGALRGLYALAARRVVQGLLHELALLPAALLGAASLLLLADNFLYTVFGWGTPSLEGRLRAVGPIAFLAIFLALSRRLREWERVLADRRRSRIALLAAAGVITLVGGVQNWNRDASLPTDRHAAQGQSRPNILLLGGDGIEADRMSVYGAERATTPNLDRLARESIVAENFFANVGATAGSIVSLFTSALPSETGVVFAPDTVRGEWVGRHLPGLLREHGYTTVQLTNRWYAD
ncbi:MAG TPA: sulfatase-like hydrolase/transferase, partial [Thermoanaerobaculia bacterium]|nr:sulfatase-like hydrolase/transferase [Thermoanaerobaculia bacterium]